MIDFDKLVKDAIGNTSTSDYEANSVADVDSVIKSDTKKIDYSAADKFFTEANEGKTGYTFNDPEIDKYKKELNAKNLQLSSNNIEELQKKIEDSQSNWEKAFNATSQTVISEITLGTGIAIADLCNFVLQKTCIVPDDDFDNPISAKLTEWQEKFNNEVAPIYYDKDLHITNGGVADFGWWMSNMPNVASSLTLLIPSTMAVKGISMAGKALNVGAHTKSALNGVLQTKKVLDLEKLNAAQKFVNSAKTATVATTLAETGANATLSRIMENYQEARQTYNDVVDIATDEFVNKMTDEDYQNWCNNHKDFLDKHGIDGSSKLEVAQAIAKESGDETFKDDMINVTFDIIELYGLKNVWKGVRAIKETGAKVTRENTRAARYFANSESETARAIAEEGFGRRFIDRFRSNFSKGTLLPIAGQISEAVEEGVNYISSQEGISYGKTLLGYNRPEEFSTRLSEYMDAPELYDSAFWGFMGGVTFNLAGGQIMRAGYNVSKRYEDKKNAKGKTESDLEAETDTKSKAGFEYYDLPENKGRISEIQERTQDSKQYVKKVQELNSNETLSPEEKRTQLEDLTEDYVSKITVRAMRHGNLGLLKDMFKNKELKQSMIDNGIVSKENADVYLNDILNSINETVENYDAELNKLTAASSAINATLPKGDPRKQLTTIPMEYIHIMAQQNLDLTNDIEKLNKRNANLDLNINKEIARINKEREDQGLPQLDVTSVERANAVKNTATIVKELREKVKELENDGSITGKLEAEKYRSIISKMVSTHSNTSELAMIADVILRNDKNGTKESDAFFRRVANQYTDDKDFLREEDDKIIKSLDLDKGFDVLYKNKGESIFKTDDNIKTYNDLVAKYSKHLEDYDVLNTLLENKAINTAQKSLLANTKLNTIADVRRQANMIHNFMSEARHNAITASNKIITEMYLKDAESTKAILNGKLKKAQYEVNNLTKEDTKLLEDAIDVLNLSQGYNTDLYDSLIKTFKMLDKTDRDDTTPENSVSSENQISATETTEPINSSSEEEKRIREQQTGQIEPSSIQPTMNDIVNKNYSYDAKSSTLIEDSKGVINLARPADGTDRYMIIADVNDWNPLLNEVFEGPADKSRKFEIAFNPIVNLLDGKLVVTNKGLLKNIVQTEPTSIMPEPSGTTMTQTGNENQENQTGISSTGVLEPNNNQGATQEPTNVQQEPIAIVSSQEEEVIPEPEGLTTTLDDRTNIISQAGGILIDVAETAIQNKQSLEDALLAKKEELVKDYKNQGFDANTVESALNKIIYSDLIPFYNDILNPKNDLESSIVELQIANYDNQHKLISDLNKTVEKVLNNYKKEKGCITIDGKLFINVHSMLRYINDRFNDPTIANYIYDSIKGYLNTTEASTKYVVTDEDINAFDFLEQVKKSKQELLEEKVKATNDVITLADITNIADTGTNLDQVIDNINIGDPVSTEVKDDKLLFKVNNTLVGYLAIPKIDKKSGRYKGINKDWVVEIYKDGNGIIQSPLKTYVTNLILGTDDSSKTINTLLTKYTFDKLTNTDKESLAKQIVQLIDNTGASKLHISNADPVKLIDYLASIYKYFNPNHNEDGIVADEVDKQIAKNSIAAWFNKVFKSYDDLINLSRTTNANVSIDSIAEGELLRIYDDNKIPEGKLDSLALPSEVLVNKEATLGVLLRPGEFTTKDGTVHIPNYSALGSISLIFPNKNGNPQIAFVAPRKLRDERPNSLMSKINTAITTELYNAAITGNYNAIKEVLSKYFNNDKTTATLFQGMSYKEDYNNKSGGYHIRFGINGTFIDFYEKDAIGNLANQARIGLDGVTKPYFFTDPLYKQQLAKALKTIFDNITFSVSNKLITLDGNKNQVLNNGCINTVNGKFKVTFGTGTTTFTEEYDSYNDFLLSNDLVRVNLKKNENGTSNFDRRSSNPNAKSKINVKIEIASSTPVEESTKTETTAPKVVQRKGLEDKIDNAIVNPKADIATTLAKLCLTQQKVKALQDNNLLPSGVKYSPSLNNNGGPNATYNPETKTIIIGNKLKNLFKTGVDGQNRGIRILIHEQLHTLFRATENAEYKTRAKEVFEEYKTWVKENTSNEDPRRVYTFENYKLSTGEEVSDDHKLEEFLVEALTNAQLRSYLNEIEATSIDRTNRKESLLSKLMDIIAKVFGWNKDYLKTREGSLLDKLNNDLKDIEDFSATNIVKKSRKRTTKKKVIDDGQLSIDFNADVNVVQQPEIKNEDDVQADTNTQIEEVKAQEDAKQELVNEHDDQAIQLSLFDVFNDTVNTTNANDQLDSSNEPTGDVNLDNINLKISLDIATDLSAKSSINIKNELDESIDTTWESNIAEESNIDTSYSQEMQSIKDKAIADGTFMKAPNGRPTNLTERQWLQVRTKAFKDWFGDWINDPENASKVVDTNREPLVVLQNTLTSNVYIAYESNQIKSATDNIGEFGVDSNNIYESNIDEVSRDTVTIVAPEIDKFIARLDPKIAVEFRRRIESDELKTYCR